MIPARAAPKAPAKVRPKPGKAPCLPVWLEDLVSEMDLAVHSPTLPEGYAMSARNRASLEAISADLSRLLEPGPIQAAHGMIAGLMLAYNPGMTTEASETLVWAYRKALEDVPAWALEAAITDWLQDRDIPAGANANFRPAPPILRRMCERHLCEIRARLWRVAQVLNARELPGDMPSPERRKQLIAMLREAGAIQQNDVEEA